jgi:N-methylhydantoinase B
MTQADNSLPGDIDPITMEVLGSAVLSICDEMAIVLSSTARSALLSESGDFACTMHDGDGLLVAQTNTLPALASLARDAVPALLSRIDADVDLEPGDVYFTNHIAIGGSHISDVKAMAPIYIDGQVFAWLANCCHWPDVGGAFASGYVASREIFQEGLIIPPIRFYRRGELDPAAVSFVMENVRAPTERLGDVRAQVAAIRRGERRLLELVDKYGADVVRAFFVRYLDYTERRVRAEIEDLPDGTYRFVDWMDNNGIDTEPVRLEVAVTVSGDEIACDFSGSDPQVAGPINGSPSVVLAGANFAVRGVTDPAIPINEGCYRPLTIHAPEGTWLNADRTAARQHSTHETGNRVMDTVLGALSQAVPDRVPAAMHGTSSVMIMSGRDPDFRTENYVLMECLAGGFGARPRLDGIDGIRTGMGNQINLPTEVAEIEYPVVTERYELVTDSGGAGKYRGGLALERVFRIRDIGEERSLCISVCERTEIPPYGLNAGSPGEKGRWAINVGTDREQKLRGKDHRFLGTGETFHAQAPGGGGWGDPFERSPSAVADDVVNGKVSLAAAGESYGVVIDPATMTVDEEGTSARRKGDDRRRTSVSVTALDGRRDLHGRASRDEGEAVTERTVRGIIPALVTPFDDEEALDLAAFERVVDRVLDAGVHGLLVAGSQGEGYALSEDEHQRLTRAAVETSGGRAPVFVGALAITTAAAIRLARQAQAAGADGVVTMAPFFVQPSESELEAHFRAIAAAVDLPVLLYDQPRTHIALSRGLVGRLSQTDNIVGIKDSSSGLAGTLALRDVVPEDFSVLMGNDGLIAYALAGGADGAVAASANAAPGILVRIYDCVRRGQLDEAFALQRAVAKLRDAFELGTFPAVVKEALSLMGEPVGTCRRPVGSLSEEARTRLRDVLGEVSDAEQAIPMA